MQIPPSIRGAALLSLLVTGAASFTELPVVSTRTEGTRSGDFP